MISVLAPQGINDATVMVIFLSFSFSMVLVPMIPGIEHPVPIRIGIKLFPDRPNFLNILSRINAILAMYPTSSRMDTSKNIVAITGK